MPSQIIRPKPEPMGSERLSHMPIAARMLPAPMSKNHLCPERLHEKSSAQKNSD